MAAAGERRRGASRGGEPKQAFSPMNAARYRHFLCVRSNGPMGSRFWALNDKRTLVKTGRGGGCPAGGEGKQTQEREEKTSLEAVTTPTTRDETNKQNAQFPVPAAARRFLYYVLFSFIRCPPPPILSFFLPSFPSVRCREARTVAAGFSQADWNTRSGAQRSVFFSSRHLPCLTPRSQLCQLVKYASECSEHGYV